ncbi:MAG: HD domain-containing protein [Lachnospiraceae bacterium]|nr:HD domain-containing protein [Lachnospiraceae bacterium]
MRLISIEDLKEGNVIANDVLLEDYTVVLGKGTVVKKQYIDKLRELNIFTVYIEEEDTSDKPSAPVVEKKEEKEEKPEKKHSRLSMETVTILRQDVEEQIKNKVKDILELHVYQKTSGLEKIAETAQNIIADILEEDEVVEKVYDVKERSADIYEHSLQVCTIATLIALKLGMTQRQVYDISVSSLIHDLGMRYLVIRYEDQDINLLPAKDQSEYKKHPIYGYTAIKSEDWLSEQAKEIVLNHHERKDRSGYPLGTDLISRETQIVAVCDEFDELICGIGKARVRVHEAINNIRNYSGIWFDSDIVDAFLQLIAVYPAGSRVKTNQGETGIVLRQNMHFPERPILRITHDRFGQVIQGEKLIDLIKDTSVVIQQVIK